MSSLSYYNNAQRKYCTAVQKKRHAQSQTRWTRRKQTSQDAQPKTAPRSRQPAKVPRPVHPRPRITPLPAHMKPTPYHQTPRPSIQSTHECATVTCVLSHATPEALSRSSSTPHSFPILFFLIKQCVERLTLVRPPRH